MKRDLIDEFENSILEFGEGPLYEEMPKLGLSEKLQDGPTAAHRIEEVQTPKNYAYITCTTGSSAFQNIVGVTYDEIPLRKAAAVKALSAAGLESGQKILVSYPPLMSVFTPDAIREYGLKVSFIKRPSRDALLAGLLRFQPDAVVGESSFLRAALSDAGKLGVRELIPENLIIFAAGSPMDPELIEETAKLKNCVVHDLYGCQEFGWLCMDGIPLREDIVLMDVGRKDGKKLLLCGGLPTGDCFPEISRKDEKSGLRVATAERVRLDAEPEVIITGSNVADRETLLRCAKTILRCKAKIVRVDPACRLRNEATELVITVPGTCCSLKIQGPASTMLFDALLSSQRSYQKNHRADPVWDKKS